MNNILRLDLSGNPQAWISREDAVMLYVKDQVVWELGETRLVMLGGRNRMTSKQSFLEMSPVIATRGDVRKQSMRKGLTNRMLFKRDQHICMYCGESFSNAELTRDHVIPRAQGGKDIWENVVAACKRCNHAKADRTPEQAGMPLLAVPFRPNRFEAMYLSQHRILADQMGYLSKQFSGKRDWLAA